MDNSPQVNEAAGLQPGHAQQTEELGKSFFYFILLEVFYLRGMNY